MGEDVRGLERPIDSEGNPIGEIESDDGADVWKFVGYAGVILVGIGAVILLASMYLPNMQGAGEWNESTTVPTPVSTTFLNPTATRVPTAMPTIRATPTPRPTVYNPNPSVIGTIQLVPSPVLQARFLSQKLNLTCTPTNNTNGTYLIVPCSDGCDYSINKSSGEVVRYLCGSG
jgi:hypothetical protein